MGISLEDIQKTAFETAMHQTMCDFTVPCAQINRLFTAWKENKIGDVVADFTAKPIYIQMNRRELGEHLRTVYNSFVESLCRVHCFASPEYQKKRLDTEVVMTITLNLEVQCGHLHDNARRKTITLDETDICNLALGHDKLVDHKKEFVDKLYNAGWRYASSENYAVQTVICPAVMNDTCPSEDWEEITHD